MYINAYLVRGGFFVLHQEDETMFIVHFLTTYSRDNSEACLLLSVGEGNYSHKET